MGLDVGCLRTLDAGYVTLVQESTGSSRCC